MGTHNSLKTKVEIEIDKGPPHYRLSVNKRLVRSYALQGKIRAMEDAVVIYGVLIDLGFEVVFIAEDKEWINHTQERMSKRSSEFG